MKANFLVYLVRFCDSIENGKVILIYLKIELKKKVFT